MNLDDLLANPIGDLPADAIPLHAVVLVEYAEPASDLAPAMPRIVRYADDELTAWSAIGMLHFALQLELNSLADLEHRD